MNRSSYIAYSNNGRSDRQIVITSLRIGYFAVALACLIFAGLYIFGGVN